MPAKRVMAASSALLAALLIAPVARADVPQIAGTTVVNATASGYSLVRLPSRLKFDGDGFHNKSFSIESKAPIAGVVLVQDQPSYPTALDDVEHVPATLVAFRTASSTAMCGHECGPDEELLVARGGPVEDGENPFEPTLPAGVYRLFAITPTGSPVRATIRVAELPGTLDVVPAVSSSARLESLPAVRDDANHALRGWGDSAPMGNWGILVTQMGGEESRTVVTDSRLCMFEGGATPEQLADPQCDGETLGFESMSVAQVQDGSRFRSAMLLFQGTPEPWGISAHFTEVGAMTNEIATEAGWVELGTGAQPPTAPAPVTSPRRAEALTHGVRLASKQASLHGRRVAVALRCGTAAPCRGRLRSQGKSYGFALAASQTAQVIVRVSSRLATRVRRAGRASLRIDLLVPGRRVRHLRLRLTRT